MANDRNYGNDSGQFDRRSGKSIYQDIKRSTVDEKLNKRLEELQKAIEKNSETIVYGTEEEKKAAQKTLKAEENKRDALLAEKKARETLTNAVKDLKSSIDSTMKEFISSQESMAYNLNGTSRSLSDVTSTLSNAIGTTGIVQQKKVYENLTALVRQGIVNNAEQRAYLQTLSDDLGMIFDVNNGALTRLIRLQNADLTSHRMAIQASLKEFLNQNYRTSEYIHEGFQQVSESLLEAQSLMSATNAVGLESTIQK